ncbi:MAG: hypothetical protein GY906_21645, partial [bacterium]|nr:hypothetical protein [bacterium]
FTLRHGGRVLIDVAPATDHASRFEGLFRRRITGSPRRFEATSGSSNVRGLIALGRGSGRPRLVLLVNGRSVRDRLLVGAVMRSLREVGARLGGATIAIFLEVPHDVVDVNVHPSKAEVRFIQKSLVFSLVDRAVRSGIAAVQGRVEVGNLGVAVPSNAGYESLPGSYAGTQTAEGQVSEGPSLFSHPAYGDVVGSETSGQLFPPASVPVGAPAVARHRSADTPFGRLIGQYRNTYLLLEDEHGLVIVDQHVAHERVLYDRFRAQLEKGGDTPSQRLLEPLLFEVGPAEVAALGRVEDLLARVGIEADVFGEDTVRMCTIPTQMEADGVERVVREVLENATELDGVPEQTAERLIDELAASLSCRAAVKANDPLTVEEQRALLDDLARSEHPFRCPHGRPIILKLRQEEMDRRLGRR